MSQKPSRYSKRITCTVLLAAFLTTGLSACQQGWPAKEVVVGILVSPKDSVTPEGLDEITSETTQDEVLQILGSRYERQPNRDKWPDDLDPNFNVFLYQEGHVTKYIEVWYTERSVDFITYGYDEIKGIE